MSRMQAALAAIRDGMQYVAASGAVGLSLIIMYPHLWGIRRIKNMMQMYRDGEPEPVDAKSKQMGQEILDRLQWDVASEANVDFFTVYGQDICHFGSTFSRNDGIIGIPFNFRYQSVNDVEKEKLMLKNQAIDWSSPASKQILDSLVLSEKSKQFAIARELFYIHTFHPHVKGVLVGVSFFLAYWMGAAVNATYSLSRRLPLGSRVVIYSFFTGIGATMYCFASDTYSWYRDSKVDRQAAELGSEYAEGGVEFYNKLLQRNIALRTLMGPEGGKYYTAYGNDIHFWRSPGVPLTSRRDAVQKIASTQQDSAALQEIPLAKSA